MSLKIGQKALEYFQIISQIPRPSYHEEKIASYLMSFAHDHHLEAHEDAMHNIIIYAPASPSYEDHPALMLQGHIDMVPDKEPGYRHDFENDPLKLEEKNGFLTAYKTTLGADDGIAVAFMLAILDTPELKHPPLECVFTVQEEVGLYGAFALDASLIHARRMFSLDEMTFGATTISSCGGCGIEMKKQMRRLPNDHQAYVLTVSQLAGGHSGEDINKNRDNAIIHAARLMKSLGISGVDYRIVDINGGSKSNAIPRYCSITFTSAYSPITLSKIIKQQERAIEEEFADTEPSIKTTLRTAESYDAFTTRDSLALIDLLFLLPNGLRASSALIENLSVTSSNLGVITTDHDTVTIDISIRTILPAPRDHLSVQMATLAKLFDFSFKRSGDYGGWNYDPDSPLRAVLTKAFRDYFQQPMKEIAEHGGLETSAFKEKIPDMDIVTLGCNVYDYHTPQERLDLKSFLDTADFLAYLLELL
ncbi:MAG: beta-Ala-His dipeptidase [bacterium]